MKLIKLTTRLLPLLVCTAVLAQEEAVLFDELVRTRQAATAVALAERGEASLPYLVRGLESGGRLAALCAWALWQHPQPGASGSLRGLLWQSDQVTGYWAARALGRIPSQENVDALAKLLPDERLGFWELASGGVGRVTDLHVRGQRMAVPAPDWMPNIRVAYAAMEALGEIGGAEAGTVLLKALQNDQYLIRFAAARSLGRMQHEPALNNLKKLAARDPVLMVRRAAHESAQTVETGPPDPATHPPELPPAIAFIKTKERADSNSGFRESYFFPKTPWYHWGENLYTLTPPRPDGALKNLTQLENGLVQGAEVSYDGRRILFSMRPNKDRDGFHIYEINIDGTGLRQLTSGNCNDVDPFYLPDGRIAFSSDRAGYQEYYHQERSRTIYMMNADGDNIRQITFNPNQDYEPLILSDGRLLYSSYRFYGQDGSFGPVRGESLAIPRIETVLRTILPDGSGDQLFYGSMRGSFYAPLRSMPFGDQRFSWHPRGYQVGVSISQARELSDGRIICVSPAGLTLLDLSHGPLDCELPLFPEVLNLAGGEEVYIHTYDAKNPVGRFTSPYPAGGDWIFVSHAPWHDLRRSAYGIYLFNLTTREMQLVYDDSEYSDVEPIALSPQPRPPVRASVLSQAHPETGFIYVNSVFNSDLPFEHGAVKYVRVIEALQMGLSMNANAAWRTRHLGTAPIHPDGSFFVEIPADTPLRFELLDEDQRVLVHETAFNYVRPGEMRGCVGCHEPRNSAALNERPLATGFPAFRALRESGDLIYFGRPERTYNTIYRD